MQLYLWHAPRLPAGRDYSDFSRNLVPKLYLGTPYSISENIPLITLFQVGYKLVLNHAERRIIRANNFSEFTKKYHKRRKIVCSFCPPQADR